MKFLSVFLIFSLFLALSLYDVSAALGGRRDPKVGGWSPIKDPQDPIVKSIGEFAVTEHNKQAQTNLKFVSVVRGETQVVAGTNYKLVIIAKDGGGDMKNYEAVVWDKPWANYRNLTSFKPI